MHLKTFEEFESNAMRLLSDDASRTRLVLKYKHSHCKLALKATDDKQTFTWKTDQQSDLARVFALNEQFMRNAATNAPPAKTFTRPKRSRPMKPKAAGGVSKKKGKQ